jgi:hypothetical protein
MPRGMLRRAAFPSAGKADHAVAVSRRQGTRLGPQQEILAIPRTRRGSQPPRDYKTDHQHCEVSWTYAKRRPMSAAEATGGRTKPVAVFREPHIRLRFLGRGLYLPDF